MNEQDAQRPLSRRERRLRDHSEEISREDSSVADEAVDDEVPTFDASTIEISPYDDDGNLRSRREIRELREQAIAQLQVEADEEAEPDEVDASDVPTEALSLDELEEIAHSRVPGLEPQPVVDEEEEADDDDLVARLAADLEPVDEETIKEPAVPTAPEETYSFPDIKPLEEDLPVFDDPAGRTIGEAQSEEDAASTSAFDEVIERAVADESATVHNSASSLILPAIPDSDALSGPIGATGELFVTGSIQLPKSLGETGGHLGVQDSISSKDGDEDDPVEILELSSLYESSDFDSAPISAKQAVSTRSSDKTGVVTPEVQKDNKKSIVLALTGGGLLLVLVAGGIWLFTSGYLG